MSDLNLPALTDLEKPYGLKTPMQEINLAYKACKFGWFHIKLLSISFIGVVCGVLVSNSTSYLLPSAECDLNMNLLQKGLLNAVPYIGMLLSSIVAGFLTDTFGRKIFLTTGFGGIFIFTLIAASSQTYEVLITAKFFEGLLFATEFSALVTLTSEFCHDGIRDRVMLCQSSLAAFSQVIIALMSWGILTQEWKYTLFNGAIVLNTWNFYLYLMSLWSLVAGLLYMLFIPESPKYLVTQKKYDEAREILIKMYKQNTGKSADTFPYINIWKEKMQHAIDEGPEVETNFRHQLVVGLHNIKPMFRRPLVVYLMLICSANFFTMCQYNVFRLWYPQLSTIVEHYSLEGDQDLCVMLDTYTGDLKAASMNATLDDVCVPALSGAETYINSIVIGFVCVLPYFVTGALVNRVGKKPLLVSAGIICSCASIGLRWASTKAAVVALFSIDIATAQVLMSLNQALTVEFFPTTTRTLAISLMMVSGRVGTLVGNVMFPILLNMKCVIPFFVMSGTMICVTIITLFLPTKK